MGGSGKKDSNNSKIFSPKTLGEKVKEVVSKEKEDLDEIILTRTRLEKGIQVSMDQVERPPPPPPPKTVSKGIQVGGGAARTRLPSPHPWRN